MKIFKNEFFRYFMIMLAAHCFGAGIGMLISRYTISHSPHGNYGIIVSGCFYIHQESCDKDVGEK